MNNTTLKRKSKLNLTGLSISSILLTLAIFVVMALILFAPVRYAQSVVKGLKLFFTAVLPGLLPFIFLTKLITELKVISTLSQKANKPMKALFNLEGSCLYPFLMSIISGYPIGSTITADLYERGLIKDENVTRAAVLSSTSGPIFVIGAVGGAMLNSPKLGLMIYISNILSAIIVSVIIGLFNRKKETTPQKDISLNTKSGNIIYKSAKDTCISLLIVGFYIALFSLFIDLLTDLKIIGTLANLSNLIFGKIPGFTEISNGIMSGIVEMTTGAKMLSGVNTKLAVSSISFLIGFGGISIIMQSLSFLSKTPIKHGRFILCKFLQGVLAFFICLVIV